MSLSFNDFINRVKTITVELDKDTKTSPKGATVLEVTYLIGFYTAKTISDWAAGDHTAVIATLAEAITGWSFDVEPTVQNLSNLPFAVIDTIAGKMIEESRPNPKPSKK